MKTKFPWSRSGMQQATEYLKSVNKYEEIKTWWFNPDTHAIWSFANRVYFENNDE